LDVYPLGGNGMSLLCKKLIYGLLKIGIHLLLCLRRRATDVDSMTDRRPYMPREKNECKIKCYD